ncbi:MAG: HRDC domain-containing protein [Chloroflexi bacterium]|nr:HRDC domain-containing protein [Chloroflexota bacterium]
MNRPQLIATQDNWDKTAALLTSEPELAIDTEANSMYAYRGRICLIQIATREAAYLLDPLAVQDLSMLGQILADPAIGKVFHGSDYDLRSFHREYGFVVSGLFDTETAARFQGMVSPNLAAVLKQFLEVDIPKSKRLQRSNWGLRPLSAEAVSYAAADVTYLIPLAARLKQLLSMAGRLEWVEEEFVRLEHIGESASEPPAPDFLRVKGSDRLDSGQLAILKHLFELREAEAERIDLPPYRVMGNDALIQLSMEPLTPLESLPSLAPAAMRRLGGRIRDAIQQGMRGPGMERPPRPRRQPPTRETQARLQKLKQWRSDQGANLGLDPALLWPAVSLERLAQDPETLQSETGGNGGAEVRDWQRREFGQDLESTLTALR